jgi:O-antigen/teichoic acid export membrane protein
MKNNNLFSKVIMPFGKSGNTYLLGAIGQGLGPVLLTPILTRMLSVQSYGEITFITSFAAILGILLSFGLPIVISRAYVLEEESRPSINKWFKQIVVTYFSLSLLLLLLGNTTINLSIISLAFPFALMQLILPLARAQDKASEFAAISILGTLSPSLAVIINSSLNSPLENSKALILGALFGSFVAVLLILPKSKSNKLLSKYSVINSVKIAYPVLPHMFAMMALVNIDKVIFGQQIDKSFSGYLQVIMLVGTAPVMILSALNHAWLNQILLQLKNNSVKAFDDLNNTILRLFALSGLLVIFIVVLNKPIIGLLNPKLEITTEIQKTIVLATIATFIYVIYLANTHLLTWQSKFWVLGISTPSAVILQSAVIYLTLNSVGYLSAALGFGSALTFQVLVLERFRSKTQTKGAINFKYLAFSILIFWLVAVLFLI